MEKQSTVFPAGFLSAGLWQQTSVKEPSVKMEKDILRRTH